MGCLPWRSRQCERCFWPRQKKKERKRGSNAFATAFYCRIRFLRGRTGRSESTIGRKQEKRLFGCQVWFRRKNINDGACLLQCFTARAQKQGINKEKTEGRAHAVTGRGKGVCIWGTNSHKGTGGISVCKGEKTLRRQWRCGLSKGGRGDQKKILGLLSEGTKETRQTSVRGSP